jgi:hypothetical protein
VDPNWFYSTLAQSSAAIVAVIGGFLTARIIADIGQARQEASQLERAYWIAMRRASELWWKPSSDAFWLRNAAEELRKGLSCRYPWMLWPYVLQAGIQHNAVPSQRLPQAMEEIASLLDRVTEWAKGLMPRQIVTDPAQMAREQEESKHLFDDEQKLLEALNRRKDIYPMESSILVSYFLDRWVSVTDFWMLYRGLEDDYLRFRNALGGQPYYTGMLLLGVSSFATIVVPMTYLSWRGGSERSVFLLLFGAVLVGFGLYVRSLLQRLWALHSIGQGNEGIHVWEAHRSR